MYIVIIDGDNPFPAVSTDAIDRAFATLHGDDIIVIHDPNYLADCIDLEVIQDGETILTAQAFESEVYH